MEAYLETATFKSEEEKEWLVEELQASFDRMDIIMTLEKWAVVEYNGSDEATLLASLAAEVSTGIAPFKTRTIVSVGARKIDGKWLLEPLMYRRQLEFPE